MGWNGTRMTGPVGTDDIKAAGGTTYNDVGAAIRNGTWNKYAKWHPVKSSSPHLATVEERDSAGRNSAEDVGMRFGVRGGAGNVTALSALHSAGFTYDQPSTWPAAGGYAYRVSDLVHPTAPSAYGYRGDAYIDLNAAVHWLGADDNVVIRGADSGMEVTLTYSPHSDALREEMLSVRDFTTNNATEYDPSSCYPCVFLTLSTGVSYMHALYKGNGSAPAQLGTGTSTWRLKTSDAPSGLASGSAGVLSIILVKFAQSATSILHPTSGYDISGWITVSSSDAADSERAWTAWFSGVPDACGIPVSIDSSALGIPDYMISTLDGSPLGAAFAGNYSGTYGSAVTVSVTVSLYSSASATSTGMTATETWDMVAIRGSGIQPARVIEWSRFGIIPGPQDITYYAEARSVITDKATGNTSNGFSYPRTAIVCPKNSGGIQ